MTKYLTAKRTDSTARKLLAIFLNLAGYAIMTAPFYMGLW